MRELVLMLNPWGAEVIQRLQSTASPMLDTLFRAITHFGDGYYVLLALGLYWCLDRRRGAHLIALYALSLAINGSVKVLIASPRPFVVYPAIVPGVAASGYSFPSGHAQLAAAFGAGLVWQYRKPWVTTTVVVLAILIAFSRVWLGVHYPHDVGAGLLLGLATTLLWAATWVWLQRRRVARGWPLTMGLAVLLAGALVVALDREYSLLAAGAWLGFVTGYLLAERTLPALSRRRGACWRRAGFGGALALVVLGVALVAGAREYLLNQAIAGALAACLTGLAAAWLTPLVAERLASDRVGASADRDPAKG